MVTNSLKRYWQHKILRNDPDCQALYGFERFKAKNRVKLHFLMGKLKAKREISNMYTYIEKGTIEVMSVG